MRLSRILFAVVFVGITLIAGGYFVISRLPGIIRDQIETRLLFYGYPDSEVGKISVDLSEIYIEKISLNNDNAVWGISVTYNPALLFRGQDLTEITIENITLSGSLSGDGFYLAGVDMMHSTMPFPAELRPKDIPVGKFSWQNLQITIDTPFGDIFILNNGVIEKEFSGMKISTRAASGSDPLSFIFSLNGKLSRSGEWDIEGSLENAGIRLPFLETKAFNGWMSFRTKDDDFPVLSMEVISDGLSVALSDQSIETGHLTISAHYENENLIAITRGKIKNFNELFWTIDVSQNKGDTIQVISSVTIEDIAVFIDFLDKYQVIQKSEISPDTLNKISQMPGVVLDVVWEGQNVFSENYEFSFSAADLNTFLEIEGRASYKRKNNALKGNLEIAEKPVQDILIFLKPFLGQNADVSGTISLETQFMANGETLDTHFGPASLNLKNVNLKTNAAEIKGISADMSFETLWPPVNNDPQTIQIKTVQSAVPLKNIELVYLIKPGLFDIQKLEGDIANGRLSIEPFQYKGPGKPVKTNIKLSDISLKEIPQLLDIEDLKLEGQVSGDIPVTLHNEKIIINNALIVNRGSGLIAYTPGDPSALVKNQSANVHDLRKALEHLEFNTLNLVINGDMNEDMSASLFLNGNNPTAFGDRPVHLKINLEGAVGALIEEALEPAYKDLLKNIKL